VRFVWINRGLAWMPNKVGSKKAKVESWQKSDVRHQMSAVRYPVRRIFATFSIVFQLRVVAGTPRRFSIWPR
jgi:hypothetical protein